MSTQPKDSYIRQILIGVATLIIASLLAWIGSLGLRSCQALLDMKQDIEVIKTTLGTFETRTETDSKIAALRHDIDLDNKLVQKGTIGAEPVQPNPKGAERLMTDPKQN